MDYETMIILNMEKTNLYFGVIWGVRIATFVPLRNTFELLDTGRSLGSLQPNFHSLRQNLQYTGKEAKWTPNNRKDPEISLIQCNMKVSHSLALWNSLCSTHFSSLHDMHSLAQGGEAKQIICAPIQENSPSGHKLALRVVTGCTQHFYGVRKVRPGHLGVPELSLLIHIPTFNTLTAPHLQHHRLFLLKASSCLDEVLDSGITKLVIDSLA